MLKHKSIRHFLSFAVRRLHLWPVITKMGLLSSYHHIRFPDTILYLDVVITECCTLRCRDCANLMQYYHHPENLDIEETITALRLLLRVFRIKQLKILGGEPFVCQDSLSKLLVFLHGEAIDRIDEIVIISNGTIIPTEKCWDTIMNTPKLKLLFSNYGSLSSQMDTVTDICRRKKVEYSIVEDEYWCDFGELKTRHEKESKTQYRYAACYSRRDCTTLYRGKLYVCPRQAHGVHLGYVPEDCTESVDLALPEYKEPDRLRSEVYHLIDRKQYISACRSCGLDADSLIPRALQAERPIDVDRTS